MILAPVYWLKLSGRLTATGGRLLIGNFGTIDSRDGLSIGIGWTNYFGEDPIIGIVRTLDYAYRVE